MRRPAGVERFAFLLGTVLLLVGTGSTAAPGDRSKGRPIAEVPLPPPRPLDLSDRRDDPDRHPDADAPPPVAPVSAAAAVTNVSRALPSASRARMYACGLEWQQIKLSGSAGERTWRDFALLCLPR